MNLLSRLLSTLTMGLLFSFNAIALKLPTGQIDYINSIKSKAVQLKLAEHKTWRALLHYNDDVYSAHGYKSYVDDDTFFYADNGNIDAESELIRTLEELFSVTSLDNEHAQCRFIYRYQWLVTQLNVDKEQLPTVNCSDYIQWRNQVNAHSVALIFPATTLNSPSSMFGHTLLRFDPKNVESGSDWLSYALNFGANVNDNDNSLFFAFRGLAGGYPGTYNMMRYFKKIKEYNRMENRDIWEYRLNLTPAEVQQMLDHVWELKDINFDYYFFDENCAFRLLELLELVRPDVNLTDQFKLSAIPTNTVRAVIDEGLVESSYFRPSELAVLHTRIDLLPKDLQKMGNHLANDIEILNTPKFLALTTAGQGEVIQVAYSYLRYIQLQTQRDEKMAKRSHQLLLALNKATSREIKVKQPSAPETGHKTIVAGLVLGERNDDAFQQLNFRMTYHDLLDNEQGYLRGAQIILFNTEIRAYQDVGIKLNRFDIIDITSLSKRNLFLKPLSWKVQFGYENVFSRNNQTGVVQVNGGIGHNYKLSESTEFYGLVMGRIEHNEDFNAFLEPALGLETGLLYYSPIGTQKFELYGYKFLNDDYRMRATFSQNFNLAINSALRLSLAQEWHRNTDFYDVSIGYRYYF